MFLWAHIQPKSYYSRSSVIGAMISIDYKYSLWGVEEVSQKNHWLNGMLFRRIEKILSN